jgi:uncharacterized protein with FMN-binding domain
LVVDIEDTEGETSETSFPEDMVEVEENEAPEETSVPVVETPMETTALAAEKQEEVKPTSVVETPVASPAQTTEPTASPAQSAPSQTSAAISTSEPTTSPVAEPVQSAAPSPAQEEKTEPEPVRTYRDGTFTGTGEGYEGPITVSVTIQDDVITAISVVSSMEDDDFFADGKTVISRILSAQSTNVDTVSGATYSSGGIIDGVKAALSSAKS